MDEVEKAKLERMTTGAFQDTILGSIWDETKPGSRVRVPSSSKSIIEWKKVSKILLSRDSIAYRFSSAAAIPLRSSSSSTSRIGLDGLESRWSISRWRSPSAAAMLVLKCGNNVREIPESSISASSSSSSSSSTSAASSMKAEPRVRFRGLCQNQVYNRT